MRQREALPAAEVCNNEKIQESKKSFEKGEKCGKAVFRLVRERLERRRRAGKMKVPGPCEAACKAA